MDNFSTFPTEDELEILVSPIVVNANIPEVKFAQTKNYREMIKDKLRGKEMTKDEMNKMYFHIKRLWEESEMKPGEAVGLLAATSAAQPITQSLLKSHQSAGGASSEAEGDRIMELLKNAQTLKSPSCTIIFRRKPDGSRPLTRDSYYLSKQLIYTTLGELITRKSIINSADLDDVGRDYLYLRGTTKIPKVILRLYYDPVRFITEHIKPDSFVSSIEKSAGEKKVYAIPYPVFRGYVDVVYLTTKNEEDDESIEDQEYILEKNLYAKHISKFFFCGIANIKNTIRVKVSLKSFLTVSKDNVVTCNLEKNRNIGVVFRDFTDLFRKIHGDKCIVSEDPEKGMFKIVPNLLDIGKKIDQEPDLADYDIYWYLKTIGGSISLEHLYSVPYVDSTLTISNDTNEIFHYFGIEAARNFLIEEMQQLMSKDDSFIDPRHIQLLADIFTRKGIIAPATIHGVRKQNIGALEMCTFEFALRNIFDAARERKSDEISSVSTSIILGIVPKFGSNWNPQEEKLETIEEEKEDVYSPQQSHSIGSSSSSLEQPVKHVKRNTSYEEDDNSSDILSLRKKEKHKPKKTPEFLIDEDDEEKERPKRRQKKDLSFE